MSHNKRFGLTIAGLFALALIAALAIFLLPDERPESVLITSDSSLNSGTVRNSDIDNTGREPFRHAEVIHGYRGEGEGNAAGSSSPNGTPGATEPGDDGIDDTPPDEADEPTKLFTLVGKVVDTSGAGIEGARLVFVAHSDDLPYQIQPDPGKDYGGHAITDREGSYKLAGKVPVSLLPADGKWQRQSGMRLVAFKEGFTTTYTMPLSNMSLRGDDTFEPGKELKVKPIVMHRASSIFGRVVVKDSGTLVPDVTVAITRWGGQAANSGIFPREAITNSEGVFRFAGLPVSEYGLQLMPYDLKNEDKRIIFLSEGKSAGPVIFEIEPPRSLIFRAATGDGTPITSPVLVVLVSEDWFGEDKSDAEANDILARATNRKDLISKTIDADSEGIYRVSSIISTYDIAVVSVEGFRPQLIEFSKIESEGTEIDAGTLVFDRGRTVTGRVVDSDDNPIAGAGITIADKEAKTNKDGSFAIDSLPPEPGRLSARAEGYVYKRMKLMAETLDKPLTVTLFKAGVVFGKVLTANGEVAELKQDYPLTWVLLVSAENSGRRRGDYLHYGTTFSIRNVLSGRYRLVMELAAFEAESDEFSLSEGEHLEVNLQLKEKENVGARLSGTVTGTGGVGLKGVRIGLSSEAGSYRSTTTNGGGSYIFPGLTPGEYSVTIGLQDPLLIMLQEGEADKTLDFSVYATLIVRSTINGLPVTSVSVKRKETGRRVISYEMIILGLPPGRYRASLYADRDAGKHLFAQREFEVFDGTTEVLINDDFVTAALSGQVLFPPSAGEIDPSRARVRLWADNYGVSLATINSDGSYRFEDLPSLPFLVQASIPGFISPIVELTLGGGVTRQDFTLQAAGWIELVAGEGNAANKGLSLEIITIQDSAGREVWENSDDRPLNKEPLRLDCQLTAGRYKLSIRVGSEDIRDYQPYTCEVIVQNGHGARIVVPLRRGATLILDFGNKIQQQVFRRRHLELTTLDGRRLTSLDNVGWYPAAAVIPGLPPGELTMRIRVPGMKLIEKRISLVVGDDTEVSVKLEPEGSD